VRLDLVAVLRRSGDRSLGGGGRARRVLVVAQVALCLAVLAGAAVVARSYRSLATLEAGFDPQGVVAARLSLRYGSFPTVAERGAFFERLREGIEALPGVEAAGLVLLRPLSDPIGWEYTFTVEGQTPEQQETNPYANYEAVSAGYFETLGVPLVAGRLFDAAERTPDRHVVVVSRGMAERYWPGGDAVGRRLKFGRPDDERPWYEVVGVVGDVRYRAWDDVRFDVYVPMEHWNFPRMDLVVRGAGGTAPAAVDLQRVLHGLDSGLALSEAVPLARAVDDALAGPRFAALAVAGLGLVALLLTAVGLGGLLAAWVGGLERELGVRLALGAERRDLGALVARQSGLLVGLGLLAGLALALLAFRALQGLVYGVGPLDPVSLATAALLLAAASAAGTAAPLRRALRADPLSVLRSE
ncbi:MAG TPA: ABC transporter permease, partial [Thermoanaerobaculia bacterium]|nr:ABC transporter permease [Thermoanaerobaculia bacterium]